MASRPFMMRTRLVAVVGLLAVTATLGCTRSPGDGDAGGAAPGPSSGYRNEVRSSATPARGGRLTYGLPDETNSWNPGLAQWGTHSMIPARAMFDFLAEYDDTGAARPLLAERFEHSGDLRTWTIHLRPGVRFTNGKPVDATAIVRGQQYLQRSPVVGEAYAYVDRWEVVDDLTVRLLANRPWALVPEFLASQLGAVADPDWLQGGDPMRPVGSGPFRLERWEIGGELVLARNTGYWRTDPRGEAYPYLDGITFRVMTDSNVRVQELQDGDVDVMLQAHPSGAVATLQRAADGGTIQLFGDRTGESSEDFVLLNTAKPPFDDRDARLAIAHATDRDAYVRDITNGQGTPATSVFAPWSRWYADVPFPSYDPELARRLVDQVKLRHGGRFTVELLLQANADTARLHQYLAAMWGAVGIEVVPVTHDRQAKIINAGVGNYQASVFQMFDATHPADDAIFWGMAPVDPGGAFSLNFARFDDAEARRAIGAAAATDDAARQKAHYTDVSRRMAEVVPFVWLAHTTRHVAARLHVVDLVRSTLPDGRAAADFVQGSHTLHQVWLR